MDDRYTVVTDKWNGGCQVVGCDDTDSFRVLDAEEETLASPSVCLFHADGYAQWLAGHEQDAHDQPDRYEEYQQLQAK